MVMGVIRQQKESRIILVRHGETEWNRLRRFQGRTDIELNERGLKQVQSLASSLRNEVIAGIYASPLRRALATAEQIKKHHPAVPLMTEPDLLEMDLGDFEGMDGKKWADSHQQFRARWEKAPALLPMPGGESLADVQKRAVQALERIVEHYPHGSTIVICSHNFVIVSLLCFAAEVSLDRFRTMRQDTASKNVILSDGVGWRIESVNDCSHLKGL